jgi:hypothetical protein
VATLLLLISLLSHFQSQDAKSTAPATEGPPAECSQPEAQRASLIREAEQRRYTIRWVMFARNGHTNDSVLRRRLVNLNEGDLFTRENLVKSLERVSRLKRSIHPIGLNDITVAVDRAERLIDIDICLKEKRR